MAHYKGFHSSYAVFIRQIRENLREGRYGQDSDCFGILKELVQNADDARARRVHIGVSGPVQDAQHSLLRAPGLFAINDGTFKPGDAEAIRCFSLNSKAADRSVIGKFGLGLKSIFHLGEVFFYLAGNDVDRRFADVLNPWSSATGTGLHPDWDEFSDHDKERLYERLSPLIPVESFFCIWVPLRRRGDLGAVDPLVGFYPGDQEDPIPLDLALGCRLGPLLPLLAHVEEIQGWRFRDATPVEGFNTRLGPGARRRSSSLAAGCSARLSGSISVAAGPTANAKSLRFVGQEARSADPGLAALQTHASWPRDFALDPETGVETSVSEKADVHGAVTLVTRELPPGARGRLRIHWSVFLPLSEPAECDLGDVPLEVELFLHGYFFVDAGRNRIEGIDQDPPGTGSIEDPGTLRRAWNHRLARSATLPALPEVLGELLEGDAPRLGEEAVGAITGAIARSGVFARFRPAVCRNFSWARVLRADGRFSWTRFPSGETYYQIPPSDPPEVMALVLPALPSLAEGLRIVRRDEPRLAGAPPVYPWPRHVVEQVVASAGWAELVADERRLAYLSDFLDECGGPDPWSSFAGQLVGALRSGLRALGLSDLRGGREGLRTFIGRLPSQRVLPVDLHPTPEAERLFSGLLDVELPVLIVPGELDSGRSGARATLAAPDVERLLLLLQTRQEGATASDDRQMIAELAAQFIGAVDHPASVRASCRNLDVFWGTDCRERKAVRFTLGQLDAARARGLLFVQPPSLAYSLQDALVGEGLVLVSKKLYLSLYPGSDTPSCREAQVLTALGQPNPPLLRGPASRARLLDAVLAYQGGRSDPNYRRSVRYLLHGRAEDYATTAPLLVSEPGTHPVWQRIVETGLTQLGRGWRLVDASLARRLSQEDREEFDVQVIGPTNAIELMREVGPGIFGELNPSDDEYAVLLRSVDDDRFCRALPIHLGVDGRYGPIDERTYLGGETELPEGLARSVRLLAPSGQEAARSRQRALAPILDPAGLCRLVLAQDQPGLYADAILKALIRSGSVPGQIAGRLAAARWLPTREDGFAKPCDVIWLPEIARDVARLTADHPDVFLEPGGLAQWVREDPGFPIVERDLFPNREVALSMLGTLLLEDERNRVGEVEDGLFEDWLEAMQEISTSVIPSVLLLRETGRRYREGARRVFAELRQPIPAHRIKAILDHLRTVHRSEPPAHRKARIVQVFCAYLGLWIDRESYLDKLRGTELPTQAGGWRSSAELCWHDDGVSPDYLLDPAVERTLGAVFPETLERNSHPRPEPTAVNNREPGWSDVEVEVAAAARVLGDYFSPWQDVIPGELIGGFLALLGDEPGVRRLAQAHLGKNRTVEETRLKFGLPETIAGRGMEDGPTMISKQRVVVEVCRGPTVRLRNILGQPIEAPKREVPAVLFLGHGRPNNPFPQRVVDGTRVLWFRLNEIDLARVEPATLSRLLRDSSVRFIGAAYNSYEHQTRFAAAWDELAESDQLDISIAQSRVIENGLLILDQLGLRSDRRIAAAIDRWDAAQRLDAEQRLGPAGDRRASTRSAARELELAKAELRSLLEDPDQAATHQRILEAIRSRVGEHFQYEPGSVPFELFQNADDSSVELVACFAVSDAARREATRFLVIRDGEAVQFAHFGRRINQYSASESTTARTRGFDDDLWKMLVLSLSNKPATEEGGVAPVTGKFGLGFKSVFLVSDRPRILSGRLAFEVTGGVYPRRLVGAERLTLDRTRTRLGSGQAQATILELPSRQGGGTRDFLDRFLELAHFEVVFARSIRRIGFEPGGAEVRWDPAPLPGVPGCLVGTLVPLDQARERGHETSRVIVFQGSAGSLLFRLGSRALEHLPADVPTIWVTAPTRERLPLGFLMNGPFALDIGRAQIARDPAANRPAAEALGRQFGGQLTTLYDASLRSWEELRTSMGLEANAIFSEFWDSVWGLLADGLAATATRGEPVDLLVREVLWGGRDRGVFSLCQSRAAIPSRLDGPYAPLVTLGQIRFAVRGGLADTEGLFGEILRWPSVWENAPAGTVVRDRGVAGPLRQLCGEGLAGVRPLTLAQVLAWEFETHHLVDPEHATRFGSSLTRARLEQIGEGAERAQIRHQLDAAEFLAVDGDYHPARELLLGHPAEVPGIERQEDERRRARFAPASRVLAPAYDGAGVEFFLACRERLEAPTRLLAEWVVLAAQDEHRRATLEYLADGELGLEIQRELIRRGLAGTWLERLSESPAFLGLARSQQLRLGALLPEDTFRWNSAALYPNAPALPRAPELILGEISEWWSRERGWLVAEYERRIYPEGRRPALLDEGFEGRKGWVTLLLLGLTHTMGRTRAEAHRSFLADCDRRGWLDMFAASERAPERWMQFIDGYLSEQVDDSRFLQWMKQFVGIYQVSRYLEDYVEIFRSIDRIGRPFGLAEVTVPNTSVLLQGSGIEVPPLARTLGIGACFVTRELVRLRALTTPHAHPHCYPPVKRVRDLCMQLGCPPLEAESRRWEMSREIYAFLVQILGEERATFQGDFDIPLLLIAEDESLQERFLEVTLGEDEEEE